MRQIDRYDTEHHKKVKEWQGFIRIENAKKRYELQGIVTDALLILNIQSNNITIEDIETAYYEALAKYHRDHTPAWREMEKIVTNAYNILMAQNLSKINKIACGIRNNVNYGEIIDTALTKVVDLPGMTIKVDGVCVWVSGNTKAHREALKQAGFCQGKRAFWFL